MKTIHSKINSHTSDFKSNSDLNNKLYISFQKKLQDYISNIPDKVVESHKKKGKLIVRDRINNLLDDDSFFIELSAFAAYNQYDNTFPSAGIVTGIGLIHSQPVVVIANDATVKGGTYVKQTIKKHIRAQEIAYQNHLPVVYLVDSGGVFLPEQAEVFPDKDDFGKIFYNQAQLSAKGIVQVSLVLGSCTAGGAYIPAMSDETIIVQNQGTIFLGGPPLVKAATGEDVTAEELGGGDVHAKLSGVADHLAKDENEAFEMCRDIFESFNNKNGKNDIKNYDEPLYKIDEIGGIVPANSKESYDAREVIARLVDGSEFHEFKAEYGKTLVTGFAQIMGQKIGIIANNGILYSESSLKGTHFIELCSYRKIPIVFLQNISGFMVGKQYEHGGIARDGAKMVHAVTNTNVPKITIIIGGSFGAGNYAMSGRAFNPRFLFMWPNAKISVMGGEQAANVLASVKEDQLKRKDEKFDEKVKEKLINDIKTKYETEGSCYYSSSRLWDDGVIHPYDTRKLLGILLPIVMKEPVEDPKFGVYRM